MPAAIRYPPGVMVSHLNNTFSDLACFSAEIIKAKIWFQLAVLKSRLTCTDNSESWCGLTTALMLTEHCSLLTKRRTALAWPNTYTYIWHFLCFFYNHRASQDLSDNDRHLSLLFWPDKYLPPSKPPSVPSPPVHPFSTWSAFPWFQLQKFLQLLPVFRSGNKFTMKSHFHSPGFFLLFWLALGLQQVKQH